MSVLLRNIAFLLIFIIICGCITSTEPQFSREIDQPNANFILYVSNQSYDKPTVDISIAIDGKSLIDDTYRVRNQHYWETYAIKLEPGIHTINAVADKGTCILTEQFTITNKHWAVLSFFYKKDKAGNTNRSKLTYEISDKPYGFL